MAQTLTAVTICVQGTGFSSLYDAVNRYQTKCFMADGSTVGYTKVVNMYLSDQPIVADSSSGAGSCANPFALSASDGAYLSAAIVGCWAAAYAVRSIINVVRSGVES